MSAQHAQTLSRAACRRVVTVVVMLAGVSGCANSPTESRVATPQAVHPTEPTVEVELSLADQPLHDNAVPPPAHTLVIPRSYIDVQSYGLLPSDRMGPMPLVILAIPYRHESSSAQELMQLSVGLTTDGFKTRIQKLFGPAVDVDAAEKSTFPPGLHLVEWLGPSVSPTDLLHRSDYVGEDAELGFIWVSCLPSLQRSDRTPAAAGRKCMVVASLTQHLITHVGLDESALPQWRARLISARDSVMGFVQRDR